MKKESKTKTNHQTGWHKPVVNPTTNYPMDSHKEFCKRCLKIHEGKCPATKSGKLNPDCNL